jgi:hypothetical protein
MVLYPLVRVVLNSRPIHSFLLFGSEDYFIFFNWYIHRVGVWLVSLQADAGGGLVRPEADGYRLHIKRGFGFPNPKSRSN